MIDTSTPEYQAWYAAQRAARGKYPWAEWLDGKYHVAIFGEDFAITTSSFRAQVHLAAGKHGLRVKTRVVETSPMFGGKAIVLFRVLGPGVEFDPNYAGLYAVRERMAPSFRRDNPMWA